MPCTSMVAAATDTRHDSVRRATSAGTSTPRSSRAARARRPKGKAPARARGRRNRERLGNTAESAATAGQSVDRRVEYRQDRYRARAWLSTVRTEQHQKRWRDCGRASINGGGAVGLRITSSPNGRAAGYSGLATCGSPWACPVCSAKIAQGRTQELDKLLVWNAERGGSVALASFTMRHHKGTRLRDERKALSVAWRHITSHRAWKTTRKALGCDGYVRAIDVTTTDTAGWHLHIHVLLVFDGPVSQELIEPWTDELYTLWSAGLAKSGFTASRERGVDVRVGEGALDGLGKYLNKLTYETAGARFKRGKKGKDGIRSRTPFEVLDDAINDGRADDFDLWFEWERDSKGMQQLLWSNGLKDRVGVDDKSDEDLAEEEIDGEDVALISAESWTTVYWLAADLLTAAEADGTRGAFAWLDQHGIDYEPYPTRCESPSASDRLGLTRPTE